MVMTTLDCTITFAGAVTVLCRVQLDDISQSPDIGKMYDVMSDENFSTLLFFPSET